MPVSLHDGFSEFVILLLIAAVIGVAVMRLRLPLVIGFIAVGILAGPSGLQWIQSTDQIHVLAEMGLALLLFVVGLKLDIHIIRTMGMVAVIAGLSQLVLTLLLGYLLVWGLGLTPVTALYVALALTLSSTIIIVKLLSDKQETESLQGRLTLGILIVQDLVVVLAMIVLSAISGDVVIHPMMHMLIILAKGAAFLISIWVATVYLFPRVLPLLSRSIELLVLFGIAWALALALLCEALGFGKEVGAFLAGISLASTAYRDILGAKLVSLRDFLLLFFFIELGSQLNIGALKPWIITALVLAGFVLLVKPVLVMIIMSCMGYRKRTGFMTGLYLAQISEFSLILMAMGASMGHVKSDMVGVITLVGLITIGLSSYFIQHAQGLYDRLMPLLTVFDQQRHHREDATTVVADSNTDIILFGIGEYGSNIAEHLQARGRTVLGVDFDPQAVKAWTSRGWHAVFGDAEDSDFALTLPLSRARWVVSAIREPRSNIALVRAMRHIGYTGNIAFTARNRDEGEALLKISPGLLLVPSEDAAVQAVDLLYLSEEQIARETMDKLIESISNHYIVCGYGRMGQQIVKDFRRQAVPFVVIEDNPTQLPKLKNNDLPFIVGNASQDEILIQAGIVRAKGLIAVTSTDEENVFIVLTARGINPDLDIVARSILEENEDKLRRAGANRVMSPYVLGGRRMAAAVIKPGVVDFLDLVIHSDKFETDIAHIMVPHGVTAINSTLQKLGFWQSCGVTVLALQRSGEDLQVNPCPDAVLQEGDELIIMGTMAQIEATRQYLARIIHDEEEYQAY